MEFSYRALNRAGDLLTGRLDALSAEAAVAELGRREMTPVELQVRDKAGRSRFALDLHFKRRLPARDLVVLTQALASLLKAGLMLDRALYIIGRTNDKRAIRNLCQDIERHVRQGSNFSDALKEDGNAYPNYFIAMVRAAEAGGSLPEGLERLSVFLARAAEIRERIVGALIYPSMLIGMVVLTMIMILTVVLPRFQALFDESRAQLPWVTRAVLVLGESVSAYGWYAACALLIIGVLGYRAWKDPVHGSRLSEKMLRAKWTFGLISKVQTSRFIRTMGTLSRNGAPLPEAAQIAIGTIGNRALRTAAEIVHTQLKQGQDLSTLLDQSQLFPKAAVQLARVGEETGRLNELLIEAADTLDRDAQNTIDRLIGILVPATTIAMGALVAAMISSVLVGVLSLNDLAF